MLRITVRDAVDRVNLKCEGHLCGSWVAELEECWRATSATLAGRELCLDLTAVSRFDTAGKYLLALLRRAGAELIASGVANIEVVERIARDWPCKDENRAKARARISEGHARFDLNQRQET